jgi:Domain of unknown function (DUF6473)
MSEFYETLDRGLVDYDMYAIEGLRLRGPKPARPTIAFVGAAQTFGRYRLQPFPAIVGKKLDVEVLNLGVGGKGPGYFVQSAPMLEMLNRCRLVIVQVMSGRSVSTSIFHSSDGGSDGTFGNDRRVMQAEVVYDNLLRSGDPGYVQSIFQESRENYVAEMIALLREIVPPKILFWFSARSPERQTPGGFGGHQTIAFIKDGLARLGVLSRFELAAGCFPHLIDRAIVARLTAHADRYVECTTSRGLPELLSSARNRHLRWNNYYPSVSMHRAAAAALAPICRDLLA